MNLYGFAGGDPTNYSDPFGLFRVLLEGEDAQNFFRGLQASQDCPPNCRVTDWSELKHVWDDHVLNKRGWGSLFNVMLRDDVKYLINEVLDHGSFLGRELTRDGIRLAFEYEFKSPIGKSGETMMRVILDDAGRLITAFPAKSKMLAAGGAWLAVGTGLRATLLRRAVGATLVLGTGIGAAIDILFSANTAWAPGVTQ